MIRYSNSARRAAAMANRAAELTAAGVPLRKGTQQVIFSVDISYPGCEVHWTAVQRPGKTSFNVYDESGRHVMTNRAKSIVKAAADRLPVMLGAHNLE